MTALCGGCRPAAQNFHPFGDLPGKVRRLWAEHWGGAAEAVLVVASAGGDVSVFAAGGAPVGLWFLRSGLCAAVTYETEASDVPDRAMYVIHSLVQLARAGCEGWVDGARDDLARLATDGPNREEN